MKKEFLTDTAVQKALHGLKVALDGVAHENKTELKSLFIVSVLEDGSDGVAMIGCVCPGCIAAAGMKIVQAGSGQMRQVTPAAVH